MEEARANDDGDGSEFRRGWTGLYLFVLVYGLLQIVLLYLFTLTLNHS